MRIKSGGGDIQKKAPRIIMMKKNSKRKKIMLAICVVLVTVIMSIIWALLKDDINPSVKSRAEVTEIIEQSQVSPEERGSVHISMEISMLIEDKDTEVNINARNDSYIIRDENIQKQETVLELNDLVIQAITAYVDLKNKKSYMTADDGLSWQQYDISDGDAERYGKKHTFEQFLTVIDNYRKVGSERLNGIMADRYDGDISTDDFAERMRQTEMLEHIGAGELSDENIKSIYDEIGNLEVSVWIDSLTCRPQKMSVDITKFTRKMMDLGGTEDVSRGIKRVTLVYAQSWYNSVEPIEIPEEAVDQSNR